MVVFFSSSFFEVGEGVFFFSSFFFFFFFRPGSCKNRKRIPVLLFKHTHTYIHTHKRQNCSEYCPRLLECFVDIYKYVVCMSTVAEWSHTLGGGGGGNFGLFPSQPLDSTLMTGSTVTLIPLVLVDVCLSG